MSAQGVPFNTYDIQACLYDARRVEHFRHAIFETVKPGDVVVDGGSGTGILGMLAALAGASHVYCVELNPEYATVIAENARRNGLADRITVLSADATRVDLPEPVDVLICEVISSGFFYEPQLQIVANLKRFLRPGGAIVPKAVDNHVELIAAQERLYGLNFTYDARFRPLDDTPLTTRSRYLSTEFHTPLVFDVAARASVRALRSGRVNAVRIPYGVAFTDSTYATEPTEYLLNPQIVFLPEPLWVQRGNRYEISMSYVAGCSPLNCEIVVRHVPHTRGEPFAPSDAAVRS